MRLLDLFSGAGGAARGYIAAGFEVVGIDIVPQPHYPAEFRQEELLADVIAGMIGDARHAAIGVSSPIPAAAAISPPASAGNAKRTNNFVQWKSFLFVDIFIRHIQIKKPTPRVWPPVQEVGLKKNLKSMQIRSDLIYSQNRLIQNLNQQNNDIFQKPHFAQKPLHDD